MKLKYYLNGFGVGVLFATLLLSVSFLLRMDHGSVMTDEQVIDRARELGMVTAAEQEESRPDMTEEGSSAEPQTTTAAEPETTETLETTEEPETATEITEEATEEPTETPQETTAEPERATEASGEAASAPETTEGALGEASSEAPVTEDTRIVIQIKPGMSSETVSRLLEEAEVVEDASDLNSYLVNQGVARFIRIGSFEFSRNMSYEDIVKRICR